MKRKFRKIKPEQRDLLPDSTTADVERVPDTEQLLDYVKKELDIESAFNETTDSLPERRLKLASATYEALAKGHTFPDVILQIWRGITNAAYLLVALFIFAVAYLSDHLENFNDLLIAVLAIIFLCAVIWISKYAKRKTKQIPDKQINSE